MPKYARFDPAIPDPSPIMGWYDTDNFNYAVMPPDNELLEVNQEDWDARLSDPSGWCRSGNQVLAAIPPQPTLIEMAYAMLGNGLDLTCTSRDELSGTYSCSEEYQRRLQAEVTALFAYGTFADGEDTCDWPDIAGNLHPFDITTFRAFAQAYARFIAVLYRIIAANAGTLPSADVTIA